MMMSSDRIRVYQVGGAVRDGLLGLKAKDTDYAIGAPDYGSMQDFILESGGTIYLETPKYLTIRAKLAGKDADFTLCRLEGMYKDGRHPEWVKPGTIIQDLSRRDFTVNAMAWEVDQNWNRIGNLIDPFEGMKDLRAKRLRTVGMPEERFDEDALRVVRALRFIVTKDMAPSSRLHKALRILPWGIQTKLETLPTDRLRGELERMFKTNTLKTIELLDHYPYIREILFTREDLWLKPTTENR